MTSEMPSPLHQLILLATLGFIVVLVFHLAKAARTAFLPSLRRIPGPKLARWTNLPLKLAVLQGKRTQYIHNLHLKYGHFVRISPTEIAVSDLSSASTIHKINSSFTKSTWYASFTEDYDHGLFVATDVKQHAARKRLFAQPFSNTNILTYEETIRSKVDLAISKIVRDARMDRADVLKWFYFLATDVVGELSFGKSFDMLQQEKKNQYILDLQTTNFLAGVRVELPLLISFLSRIPFTIFAAAGTNRARIEFYGEAAIQNYKAHLRSGEASRSTLFTKFFDTKQTDTLTDHQIINEATAFIIAGSDTTAVTLAYLAWSILHPRHKSIRTRLLDEVATLPENASYQAISALPYLRASIEETLRLYGPASSSLPRTVPPGGYNLGGYDLPGGLTVSTQSYSIHRDPLTFDNPESFIPDRWLEPTPQMKEAFSAFGKGSRSCIGIHLANVELYLAAFMFFKRCGAEAALHVDTTDESMAPVSYFLSEPCGHKCEITM